jgi:type IV pilus assembly protein PilC
MIVRLTIIDQHGTITTLEISHYYKDECIQNLFYQGYQLLHEKNVHHYLGRKRKILPYKELESLFRYWNFLLQNGFTTQEAFNVLVSHWPSGRIKHVLRTINTTIAIGCPLSYCFSGYPSYFPSFMVELLETAQLSGQLSPALQHLSQYCKIMNKWHEKLRSKMYYIIILSSIVFFVCMTIHFFILPQWKEAAYGSQPPSSKSDFFSFEKTTSGILLLTLIFFFLFIIIGYKKFIRSHLWYEKWNLMRHGPSILLSLSLMVRGKVNLLHAMQSITQRITSKSIKNHLMDSVLILEQTGSLSSSLYHFLRPYPFLVSVIAYAQRCGDLSTTLEYSAHFLMDHHQRIISLATSFFQPICFIVIAFFLWFSAQEMMDILYTAY